MHAIATFCPVGTRPKRWHFRPPPPAIEGGCGVALVLKSGAQCPKLAEEIFNQRWVPNMNKSLLSLAAAAAMLLGATSANAVIYTFNASLNSANEVSPVSAATATGIATLSYDTADNTYDFAMAVFGLSGGSAAGTAASGFHIHGAASTTENATIRVFLDNSALFTFLNAGSTLLVGGSNLAAPAIAATPASALNQGYLAMSFLQMLQGGLAYVNVHTATNPGGAVRGQLIQVTAVPEPSTYALLLAGIAALGFIARRRHS